MRPIAFAALVITTVIALADGTKPNVHVIQIAGKYSPIQRLEVRNANVSGSAFREAVAEDLAFRSVDLRRLSLNDVNLSGAHIRGANLSDLDLGGAQLGGAVFRHIGLPPKGDPGYKEGAKQRPLRFEDCDLNGSSIQGSDLNGVSIRNCTLTGMTIDGIPVEEMLKAYRERNSAVKP